MNRGLKNDEIYDDVDNGLLFLETGMIVYRKEYIDNKESIFYGSYKLDDDGNGIISGYKTKEKLGFFKYGIPYYSKIGLLKLGNMDVHIMGKATFEDTIIRYLSTNSNGKYKHLYINLDGTIDDMSLFFLKYINDVVLTKIMWYLIRGKSISIRLEIKYNKIIYSVAHYLDGVDIDKYDSKFYNVNDFLKAYETMGLELAPPIEEAKPKAIGFPELPIGNLHKILDTIKDKSLSRSEPTSNDFNVNYCIHPKAAKIIDGLKPFRRPTGGARCTMMNEIKNLDTKTLYPKTTTMCGKSIYDEKIVEAYNQFLTIVFDKENYDGISIRVPKECSDDWFEILPCFKYVRNLAYKIIDELDLYVNIKKLGGGEGNYIVDISGTDYTTANGNGTKCMFSDNDKILTVSISDLQTRLLDIIMTDKEDSKSPIVGQGDEIKLGNELVNEIKDIGSSVSKNEVNDIVYSTGQVMNNLLRGLPFDHIDNFDLEGDNIDMLFSQSSINKRLPDPNWVDKLTYREVLEDSELKQLEEFYNKYINIVSIRTEDDRLRLCVYYKQLFSIHISIGVLEPELKFNYDYGYSIIDNHSIVYGVVTAHVVPFSYMLSNKPMNIHKDINNKYTTFMANEADMFTTINGIKGLDSNHAEKCNIAYKAIFTKYIELGILRDELNLKQSDSVDISRFVDLYELYNDEYLLSQLKPERLYSVFKLMVDTENNTEINAVYNLYNRVVYINTKYKTMFASYIKDGFMYPEIVLNNCNSKGVLSIPTLDVLWLK